MRRMIAGSLILIAVSLASAQSTKPESADVILKAALQTAGSSQKSVLVLFHASWCSWCKRLDKVLEEPSIHKPMDENYVITRLDVFENGEKAETLENPGGRTIAADLGGEQSGLPFYAFLDAKGKKLADSNVMPKNQNIGYPGSPEEIEAFGKLLQATAPRMSDQQRSVILEYLHKNAPH